MRSDESAAATIAGAMKTAYGSPELSGADSARARRITLAGNGRGTVLVGDIPEGNVPGVPVNPGENDTPREEKMQFRLRAP